VLAVSPWRAPLISHHRRCRAKCQAPAPPPPRQWHSWGSGPGHGSQFSDRLRTASRDIETFVALERTAFHDVAIRDQRSLVADQTYRRALLRGGSHGSAMSALSLPQRQRRAVHMGPAKRPPRCRPESNPRRTSAVSRPSNASSLADRCVIATSSTSLPSRSPFRHLGRSSPRGPCRQRRRPRSRNPGRGERSAGTGRPRRQRRGQISH
jgi:hypothetical protein